MTATAPRPAAAGALTRITIIGPRRRVDLVLPSDEPIGVLLPEIVAMVGYEPAGHPRQYQVGLLDGRVLEPSVSLRGAGVADGALVRIDPLTDAPPAPILHDVSDEVADDLARRRGRWDGSARRWTATAIVAGGVLLATVVTLPVLAPAILAIIGLLLLFTGSMVALLRVRRIGIALLVSGAMAMMTAIYSWTTSWPERGALWTAVVGITLLALGVATRQMRAGLLGGCTLLLFLVLWVGMFALGLSAGRTASVMAILSIGALGLLPRTAIASSGLTRLDDQQTNHQAVTRVAAEAAVDAAHRGLALACVAAAGSAALSGLLLVHAGTGWTIALACLVAVAVLLRLRAFPLTVEVVSLVTAALAIVTGLIERWNQEAPDQWWGGAAAALGLALAGLVVLGCQPEPHIRARARQIADSLEGLAVVALLPVVVGAFDVYSRLLDTF